MKHSTLYISLLGISRSFLSSVLFDLRILLRVFIVGFGSISRDDKACVQVRGQVERSTGSDYCTA